MTKNNTENKDKSPEVNNQGDFLVPPLGYDKEIAKTFSSLPLEWRRYLNSRETEIEKGFGSLRAKIAMYKWLEQTYNDMASQLRNDGITSQEDWLRKLINVEKQLRVAPQAAIKMLAESYGVMPAITGNKSLNSSDNVLSVKIVEKQLQDFIDGKDDNGILKHPFYHDVMEDMYHLLQSRCADNLEDAYEMAIWLNKTTRAKMIAEKIDSGLQSKTKEAQKAKNVAFNATSKAEPDYKKMSLREELEHRFAELGFVD